jgi:hypothetical protein
MSYTRRAHLVLFDLITVKNLLKLRHTRHRGSNLPGCELCTAMSLSQCCTHAETQLKIVISS